MVLIDSEGFKAWHDVVIDRKSRNSSNGGDGDFLHGFCWVSALLPSYRSNTTVLNVVLFSAYFYVVPN
jgi:hypothetical protein